MTESAANVTPVRLSRVSTHMARTLIYCDLYIISGHKYTPMPDYDWSLILVNDLKKIK